MVIYDKNGVAIIGLVVDDGSYSYREIMGQCKVYLEFALTEHVELPIGAYIDFQGDRYTLMSPSDVSIVHERNYEYKVSFEGPQTRFSKYRVHNPVDGRLVFSMCARPHELLDVIIANLNEREGSSVWSAGDYVIDIEKTVSFNHTKLDEALTMIAQAFDTEWEVVGHTISLHKVEYNASAPLALGYGENHGFKSGVGRTNYGENGQVEKVYVQGGDRNISLKEYGSSVLLLPKNFAFQFDGEHFSYEIHTTPSDVDLYEEDGFDSSKAVNMVTDANGFSVALANAPAACNESSLDATDIYPKRVGTVTDVRYVYRNQYLTWAQISALSLTDDQWLEVQVDIVDSNIPASLDYSEYLLDNSEPLTVTFQKGMLAGRTFNATFKKAAQGVTRPANRFELVRANIDGVEMPNATFRPNAGLEPDTYIVTNCYMPDEYICDYPNFGGAEIEMLRKSAKFLYNNKDIQLTFKGEVDDKYSKRNWANVGGKLKLGGCVSFTHATVQPDALVTRIIAIKQYINNPYSPEITLSNESVKGGVSTQLATISGEKAEAKATSTSNQRYTKRSFRDAIETAEMLIDAALEGYSEAIQPITVRTMQAIVGDESLQFRYVTSKTTPQPDTDGITYNNVTKKLICQAKIIQHMTLGIDSLTKSHNVSEYKFWDISASESAYLGDGLASTRFYLYARCLKNGTTATYELTTSSLPLEGTMVVDEQTVQVYNLLVGILNSEYDDDRSFVSLYGFTEILPGQITTDVIRSTDGNSFFDLLNNRMRFGNANRSLSWNLNNSGEFRITGGTIVQSTSGDSDDASLVTCDRGAYDDDATYYYADETYTPDGCHYVYVNKTTPSKGRTPSDDGVYWKLKSVPAPSARLVSINASDLAFIYDHVGASAPSGAQNITLSVATQNIVSPTYKWYYYGASDWVLISEQTSATLTVAYNHAAFVNGSNEARIKVVVNDDSSLFDDVSLYKVYGGTDSISAFLTNTNHSFPAGTAYAVVGSNTFEVVVFRGSTKLVCGTDFSIGTPVISPNTVTSAMMTVSVNKTNNVQNGTITVNVTAALNIAGGTVTIPVTIGNASVDLVFTWSLSLTGAKGDTGAKLRGPTEWNANGFHYENGTSTFQDLVRSLAGKYYICLIEHDSSSSTNPDNSPTIGGQPIWGDFSTMEYVATKVILSEKGSIANLVVKELYTEKTLSNNTIINPISIIGNQFTIKDDNGDEKIKFTSGSMGGGSGTPTFNLTGGTRDEQFANHESSLIDDTFNLGSIPAINGENNIVTIPAITVALTKDTDVDCYLTFSLVAGGRTLETISGAGTFAQKKVSLPVSASTQSLDISINGAVYPSTAEKESGKVRVTITIGGTGQGSVGYSAEFTIIATDGSQFRYGTEGFKTTQQGAKVIQGGTEFNMAGLGALNSLTAPKRIVFCTDYPSTMEADVFYIKVTASS